MVNEFKIPIENKRPVETVYELKDQVPSFEEFMKTYESDGSLNYDDLGGGSVGEVGGYGPCKNTSCGCFCSKAECDCNNPEFSLYKGGKGGSKKAGNGTASGGIGWGGHSISGDASFTLYRDSRSNGDLKVGTVSAGAYAMNGGLGGGVRASADVMSFKTSGVEVRAGFNVDTGAGITDDGVEVKFLGAGITIGKKLEISTPAGGVACIIQ